MSENSPVKIQINSLAALERLIGGDTELELEIRSNIVHAFTSKYLRGLVEEMKKVGMDTAVRDIANEVLYDVVTGKNHYGAVTKTRVIKAIISDALRKEVERILAEESANVLQTLMDEANAKIGEQVAIYTKHVLNNLTPKVTDAIITEKVRRKLASL